MPKLYICPRCGGVSKHKDYCNVCFWTADTGEKAKKVKVKK